MDPVTMFAFHQRARSGDTPGLEDMPADTTGGRPQADQTSISGDMTVSSEKHKQRSLSWLTAHRRKDSGISISTRSARSICIASPVPPTSIHSIGSSSSSRLSRESDRIFDLSKGFSSPYSESTAAPPEPEAEPFNAVRSPALPPKRPDRPIEGLFEFLVEGEAGSLVQCGLVPDMDDQVRRHSRELLGFSFEGIGDALMDARSRSSYASATSDSSAPLPSPITPARRFRLHQKALSETATMTHLARKISTASSSSNGLTTSAPDVPAGGSTKQTKSSRWTLTESMADIFKSQRSPKPSKMDKRPMTPSLIEAIWLGQDNGQTPERKDGMRKNIVKRLVTDAPILAGLLGSQPAAAVADDDDEVLRPEPLRRPDGLPHEPTGPRQRAIPFEIVIPPPPKSVLYTHNAVEMKPACSPQRIVGLGLGELKGDGGAVNKEFWDEGQRAMARGDKEGKTWEWEQGRVQIEGAGSSSGDLLMPPPKNPARFTTRAPTMPQLPPIPEGLRPRRVRENKHLLIPMSKQQQHQHQRSRSLSQMATETDEYVYLRSTPFTLTNPSFRHGPITFHKSEINRESLVAESARDSVVEEEEEGVDWVAFQAAIGGVGPLDEGLFTTSKGRAEAADEEESEIADEVTAWFEEFGFETHGELIASERPAAERRMDRSSWDSAGSLESAGSVPSSVNTEPEMEVEVEMEVEEEGKMEQRQHHVFDTIKLLRDCSSSVYSVSIYEGTVGVSQPGEEEVEVEDDE